jgi:3-hydroxyacyl-[acyl-carrier-protein] dehydratase
MDDILSDAMNDSPTSTTVETAVPAAAEKTSMDIVEIMSLLPHRYPFLLIDRVIEIERRTRVVAIKNVTVNEPHFVGHFPDYPIMPGVLTIEAMAQAGGTLLLTEIPDREDKLMVFTGIEEAHFRRPVLPGDQLRIEVKVLNWRSRAVKMQGICTVEGKVVADAKITCQLVPRMRKPKAAEKAEGTNA